MINITNNTARQLWQREVDRNMMVLEAGYLNDWQKILNNQFWNVASSYENGMLENHSLLISRFQEELINLLKTQYRRTINVFGDKAYKRLDKEKSLSVPYSKSPIDEFWNELNTWIETQTATKIKLIQGTTNKVIANIIKIGMDAGESTTQIAKRLRQASSAISPYRAKVIALTETHTAAVKSMDVAVASTKIEFEREWVSARDKRTRTRDNGAAFEHFKTFPAGPNRERVKQDEKFQGTGEPMEYPGDPNGSASNTVLCRCVILYHVVRLMKQRKHRSI